MTEDYLSLFHLFPLWSLSQARAGTGTGTSTEHWEDLTADDLSCVTSSLGSEGSWDLPLKKAAEPAWAPSLNPPWLRGICQSGVAAVTGEMGALAAIWVSKGWAYPGRLIREREDSKPKGGWAELTYYSERTKTSSLNPWTANAAVLLRSLAIGRYYPIKGSTFPAKNVPEQVMSFC